MKQQKLFAFWHYDQFPYCKGADIEFFDDTGKVAIKTDPSSLFNPFLIVPSKVGHIINQNLKDLTKDYKTSKHNLEAEYRQVLSTLIKI